MAERAVATSRDALARFYQLYGPVIHVRVRGLPIGQGAIRSLGRGRPSVHANAKVLKPWRARSLPPSKTPQLQWTGWKVTCPGRSQPI